MTIEVSEFGSGPETIILVHGSLDDGQTAFQAQLELGARWRLMIPNRRTYGKSPREGGVDPDVDAGDIVGLLDEGAHLVGTSMGGIVAARVAARAPGRIRSLNLIEPTSFPNAAGIPIVDEVATALERHWMNADRNDPRAFLQESSEALKATAPRPASLPPAMALAFESLITESPWLTSVPAEAIAAAAFPKLVVTGQSSPAFEAIGDKLARE